MRFFFLCLLYGNNDPSQSMSAALGLGVSAMAAAVMIMTKSRPRSQFTPETTPCASARAAETVAMTEEKTSDMAYDSDLWGLTEEGENQMRGASIPKSEEQSERVRLAKLAVQPMQVESLGTKGIGKIIPVIGRDVQSNVQPKVSGGCMFYMSEKYAQALDEHQ